MKGSNFNKHGLPSTTVTFTFVGAKEASQQNLYFKKLSEFKQEDLEEYKKDALEIVVKVE